jgi:CheY-like chemotaxis protein
VIPAYNEEGAIARIIERTLSIRPRLEDVGLDDLELIVVDDGSRDRTAAIAEGFPQVRLLRHSSNQGYGAALKTGFSHACGDLLGFLDADGTYPPERFPELCRVALRDEADLVIGSRMSGSESEMPLVRRIGNLLFANLVSLLGNHRVSDSASGMRVIRRETLSRLYPLPDGLNFTPVMSTRALHEEICWREVPIPYKERVGRSKLNVVRDGSRFLCTIVWTALSYNPVRILGGIGLGLMAVTAVIGAVVAGMRLAGITRLGPWGVLAIFGAGISAFAGVTLFSLGATSNYLVSLLHKRPIRQGLFGNPLFDRPLERHFGWMGVTVMALGLAAGAASLGLSLGGWSVERLWFYLLGSAMLFLVGLQLAAFWIVMQVLRDLSCRELQVVQDLKGRPCTGPAARLSPERDGLTPDARPGVGGATQQHKPTSLSPHPQPSRLQRRKRARTRNAAKRPLVVYIEDEPQMIDLVRLILRSRNIDLVGATNSHEGLEAVRRLKPDLVLLDLMMPEMDGWEVYCRLRAAKETSTIPVIVITVKAEPMERVLGLKIHRVDDYVTKPFEVQDLLESVTRALGIQGAPHAQPAGH